jgi:hypothetical protein
MQSLMGKPNYLAPMTVEPRFCGPDVPDTILLCDSRGVPSCNTSYAHKPRCWNERGLRK